MRLQITIIYADGRYQDVLNYHGLSLEGCRKRREDILEMMQSCINDRKIFYSGEESSMLAVGPDALASAHFKCEILEGDGPI